MKILFYACHSCCRKWTVTEHDAIENLSLIQCVPWQRFFSADYCVAETECACLQELFSRVSALIARLTSGVSRGCWSGDGSGRGDGVTGSLSDGSGTGLCLELLSPWCSVAICTRIGGSTLLFCVKLQLDWPRCSSRGIWQSLGRGYISRLET